MNFDDLPRVSQAQLKQMEKLAQEKMKQDGISFPEDMSENQETTMQIATQSDELHGEIEQENEQYDDSVEQLQSESVQQSPSQEKPVESKQNMNFKLLRERAEKAERDRDELMKHLISSSKPVQQQAPVQPEPEEDYLAEIGLDGESLAEGKHLRPVLKEVRQLKKELNSYKTQATQDTVEVKLKSQFPDMDRVLTHENLQSLSQMNPDLADMISNTPDIYKRAKLAYDMVKQFGIYKDPTMYDQDKVVAQKNAAKPRPLASVSPQQGDSPLSKANAFANGAMSKELKDQMHKEMIAAMKSR
jgi:hypothetical protein